MKRKKNFKKILICGLAFVMAFATFSLTACDRTESLSNALGNANDELNITTKKLSDYSISTPGIALAFSAPMTVSEESKTVSQTITATIYPENVPNKKIDWSIEWCVPIEGKPVSDYLTISTETDGALVATITAHKGFEGASAYVIAKTRIGGHVANCLVVYDGAPESLAFEYNGVEHNISGEYQLDAGATYDINLNLKNTLNAVGSKYGDFEIMEVKGYGRFKMLKEQVVNGTVRSSEEIVFNLEEGVYEFTDDYGEPLSLEIGVETFINPSIVENVLRIELLKSEHSYSRPSGRTGYRFTYLGEYMDPRGGGVPDNCFWNIHVMDKVSWKDALITIDIQPVITSFTLSSSIITF